MEHPVNGYICWEERQLQFNFSLSPVRAGYHRPGRATPAFAQLSGLVNQALSIHMIRPSSNEWCILVSSINVNLYQPLEKADHAVYTLSFSSLRQKYKCSVGGKWLHSLLVTKYVVILSWKALCNCKIMHYLLWQ